MRRIVCGLAIAVITLIPLQSSQGKAKGKGHGKHQDNNEQGDGRDHKSYAVAFQTVDRRLIIDYFHAQPGGLPPGLAKRGDLPPGLEKQLRRNGKLPPGLEKKLVPFPPQVEVHLPPCPPEVRRGMVGGVAVMWNSRTGLIVDAAVLF
jgi:hypothetical protein